MNTIGANFIEIDMSIINKCNSVAEIKLYELTNLMKNIQSKIIV